MIAGDPWPFKSHRSIAEVDETDRLRARRAGRVTFTHTARYRLVALEARAVEPDAACPPLEAA